MTAAPPPLGILVLCTGNSARSQIAEALLATRGRGRVVAASAGSRPAARVNPQAIEVLRRHGVDTYGSLIPNPEYTEQEWDRLMKFIDDNGLYYLNISPLTPLPGTVIWDDYQDKLTVPRKAHGLWDLSHVVLPTSMPLERYYKFLLRTYRRAVLDIRRADRLTLRTRPPIWSRKYLRLWWGAIKIMFQLRTAYRHHSPRQLRRAMDRGPELPVPASS